MTFSSKKLLAELEDRLADTQERVDRAAGMTAYHPSAVEDRGRVKELHYIIARLGSVLSDVERDARVDGIVDAMRAEAVAA